MSQDDTSDAGQRSTPLLTDQQRDQVRETLTDHPVSLAICYGSRARPDREIHDHSDIDVAVEFEDWRPTDAGYTDVFLGLLVDLQRAVGPVDVDLVDVHTLGPSIARSVFEHGELVIGTEQRHETLRRKLTATDGADDTPTPRERFDAAITRLQDHLGTATTDADRDREAASDG